MAARPLPGLEPLATGLAWASAILVPTALTALLGFLVLRGLPAVSLALFFEVEAAYSPQSSHTRHHPLWSYRKP